MQGYECLLLTRVSSPTFEMVCREDSGPSAAPSCNANTHTRASANILFIYLFTCMNSISIYMHACISVIFYVCMYVCMCVCYVCMYFWIIYLVVLRHMQGYGWLLTSEKRPAFVSVCREDFRTSATPSCNASTDACTHTQYMV
jgi:hypothetical protein